MIPWGRTAWNGVELSANLVQNPSMPKTSIKNGNLKPSFCRISQCNWIGRWEKELESKMGILSPVFVGSADRRGQEGEEDAERGAGTALHPSHTSNSQFLWKTGNFGALQKQQEPEQRCQSSLWAAHTAPGKSTSRDSAGRERGAAMPSCVPRDKSMRNPRQFLEFHPNHGQRHVLSSERINPSKACLWKGSRNANSCPHKREHSHNAHEGEPSLLLPKFPIHPNWGNSFGCFYPSN